MNAHPYLLGSILFTGLAGIASTAALADISYQQTVSVKAGGVMAGFSSEMQVITRISGDRARSEVRDDTADEIADSVHIMRLDRETTYELDPASESYKEVTLEDLRERMAKLQDEMNAASGGQALPIATDSCVWSEAKFSSKKTKERERIAGIRATRHIYSMAQSCEDESNGLMCEMKWTMEPWIAERVPEHGEVQAFYQNLADQLQMDYLIPQMPGASQMLLALFPNRWESLLDEMEDIKGYPLRNVMALEIGGDLCTTSAGVPITQDGLWSDVGTSTYNTVIDSSGRATSQAVTGAARESMGNSIGGSIGSSAIGAATGELVGGLAGMFKKKKKPQTQPARPAPDDVTLFRIQAEVTDWDQETVDPDAYEVPEGWTRSN